MGILDSVKDTFTSGSFEIENSMKVSEVCTKFKKTFGCSLRIYKGAAIADGRMTIKTLNERQTADINKEAGKLKIKATDKVGDAEEKFKKHFNIKVQIADKNDDKLVDNALTIGAASRL